MSATAGASMSSGNPPSDDDEEGSKKSWLNTHVTSQILTYLYTLGKIFISALAFEQINIALGFNLGLVPGLIMGAIFGLGIGINRILNNWLKTNERDQTAANTKATKQSASNRKKKYYLAFFIALAILAFFLASISGLFTYYLKVTNMAGGEFFVIAALLYTTVQVVSNAISNGFMYDKIGKVIKGESTGSSDSTLTWKKWLFTPSFIMRVIIGIVNIIFSALAMTYLFSPYGMPVALAIFLGGVLGFCDMVVDLTNTYFKARQDLGNDLPLPAFIRNHPRMIKGVYYCCMTLCALNVILTSYTMINFLTTRAHVILSNAVSYTVSIFTGITGFGSKLLSNLKMGEKLTADIHAERAINFLETKSSDTSNPLDSLGQALNEFLIACQIKLGQPALIKAMVTITDYITKKKPTYNEQYAPVLEKIKSFIPKLQKSKSAIEKTKAFKQALDTLQADDTKNDSLSRAVINSLSSSSLTEKNGSSGEEAKTRAIASKAFPVDDTKNDTMGIINSLSSSPLTEKKSTADDRNSSQSLPDFLRKKPTGVSQTPPPPETTRHSEAGDTKQENSNAVGSKLPTNFFSDTNGSPATSNQTTTTGRKTSLSQSG